MEMMSGQMSKSTGMFRFTVGEINAPEELPFMSASSINAIRRALAEKLEAMPCNKRDLLARELTIGCETKYFWEGPHQKISYKQNVSNHISEGVYQAAGADTSEKAYELTHKERAELMRTKYCIRYELGLCPIHQKAKDSGPLFLINNGQRFALHFDCRNCEMTVSD